MTLTCRGPWTTCLLRRRDGLLVYRIAQSRSVGYENAPTSFAITAVPVRPETVGPGRSQADSTRRRLPHWPSAVRKRGDGPANFTLPLSSLPDLAMNTLTRPMGR
jgi:hypothetical protein